MFDYYPRDPDARGRDDGVRDREGDWLVLGRGHGSIKSAFWRSGVQINLIKHDVSLQRARAYRLAAIEVEIVFARGMNAERRPY